MSIYTKIGNIRKTERVLELANNGVSDSDIAKLVDVPLKEVKQCISEHGQIFQEIDNVRSYRDKKSEILDAAQIVVLKSALSESKLEKMSVLSGIQAFEILNKANRLENNQSTENHAVNIFGKVDLSNNRD